MNKTMLQGFNWFTSGDGQFYNRVSDYAWTLKDLGFTGIWLPPAFKGAAGGYDVGYGTYDLYDLGEFDQKGTVRTKYGTKEEYLKCIWVLKEAGIKVYADVVLNHKGGADYKELFKAVRVNPDNRLEEIEAPKDIEGFTGFNFPNRKGKYSEFVWNFNHFSGTDYDDITKESGIYKILGDNKSWSQGVSQEKGNYDYLMFADINHDHPDVKEELYRWADWYIQETRVDGFRLDAVKHINDYFVRDFVKYLQQKYEGFYVFAEYWSANTGSKDNYLYQTDYEFDLFDVKLHYNFYEASLQGEHFDLRTIFDNSLMINHPFHAVTFVDNHDSQPDQALSSWVEGWFKPLAYAMILMHKNGFPCVFAGDYFGIEGEHPQPGKKDTIDKLLYCRKNFAYGDQDDYFINSNCIGWVRQGDNDHPHPSATLFSNKEDSMISMYVGEHQANKTYADYTGHHLAKVIINEAGYGDFLVHGQSVSIWIEDGINIK